MKMDFQAFLESGLEGYFYDTKFYDSCMGGIGGKPSPSFDQLLTHCLIYDVLSTGQRLDVLYIAMSAFAA